jgi:catechol 1,2-dioxygenase
VTDAVLAVMERADEPRPREIMVSLVRHLHGFAREVRLTEDEFRAATAILNEMGRLTETVLMAGSLGASSLVCLLNNGDDGQTETSQSLLGPFWRMHSPRVRRRAAVVLARLHLRHGAGRGAPPAAADQVTGAAC